MTIDVILSLNQRFKRAVQCYQLYQKHHRQASQLTIIAVALCSNTITSKVSKVFENLQI